VEDGEGFTEVQHTEAYGRSQGISGRDLAGEGMFEYGSRVGFWRIFRLFQDRDLPLTAFACALALERNAPIAAAIRESGFDVCSHGWRWIKHYELPEEEERHHIKRAVESLEKTTGQRSGLVLPLWTEFEYAPSFVEHGGFLYDGDYYGDEPQFWRRVWPVPPRCAVFADQQ
jgi:peptidoglycan/xylan/chitin deacetylase (PgdA/CDA1 family)